MHAMEEYMDLIMYGSCCNNTINNTELRQIRRVMETGIDEIKTLRETKDRVDISLKEYEELKRVNKDLLDRLRQAERILGMLDIPADVIQHIDPDSIKVYTAENFYTEVFRTKHRFRIEFDVEEYD